MLGSIFGNLFLSSLMQTITATLSVYVHVGTTGFFNITMIIQYTLNDILMHGRLNTNLWSRSS